VEHLGTHVGTVGYHIRAYTGSKAETKEDKRRETRHASAATEIYTRRINWVSLDRQTRVIRADAGYGWGGRTHFLACKVACETHTHKNEVSCFNNDGSIDRLDG
jgi:hypothetical protein